MRRLIQAIAERLDIRPNEMRALWLSFGGAFFVLGFTVLGRSIREALYLTSFDITTLPYITVAVALLSIPTVAAFSRLLSQYTARSVLEVTVFAQIVGIGLLWPVITLSRVFVVAFYIWTMLGTMVIASGFWLVTAELFPLRSAKRLFGIISAGGTAGAMVFGTSMSWLTAFTPVSSLLLLLTAVLAAFIVVQRMLPESGVAPTGPGEPSSPKDAFSTLLSDPHLRLIALVVCIATLTTTLLDYQFKESVRSAFDSEEGLASYFGRFYGFTGAAALAIQLFAGAPLLRSLGVGWALSVLPLFALFGSAAFFVAPSLLAITAVRGADLSLRRSIHRSVLEVAYLPVPPALRNKTKSFIDSVVDSVSEGLGAILIFAWITVAGQPSVRLSFFVIVLSGAFLVVNVRMKRQYHRSVAQRVAEGEGVIEDQLERDGGIGRDLLSVSMTRMDITRMGLFPADGDVRGGTEDSRTSVDDAAVARLLSRAGPEAEWKEDEISVLVSGLGLDDRTPAVAAALVDTGDRALSALVEALASERTDYVVRRRIPGILSRIPDPRAADALVRGLSADRFEVRYRACIALMNLIRKGVTPTDPGWSGHVWDAVMREVGLGRAVWEMQQLLDSTVDDETEFVRENVDARGSLSLEHTFRLLALVLEHEAVRNAFHGILVGDENLRSFSLEYLEHVLPADVREKLWPFIGDLSEGQRERSTRDLDEIVSDLQETAHTLFATREELDELKRSLGDRDR